MRRHSVESDLPEDFRGLRKGRENKESGVAEISDQESKEQF